jgi:hypothetical protein
MTPRSPCKYRVYVNGLNASAVPVRESTACAIRRRDDEEHWEIVLFATSPLHAIKNACEMIIIRLEAIPKEGKQK